MATKIIDLKTIIAAVGILGAFFSLSIFEYLAVYHGAQFRTIDGTSFLPNTAVSCLGTTYDPCIFNFSMTVNETVTITNVDKLKVAFDGSSPAVKTYEILTNATGKWSPWTLTTNKTFIKNKPYYFSIVALKEHPSESVNFTIGFGDKKIRSVFESYNQDQIFKLVNFSNDLFEGRWTMNITNPTARDYNISFSSKTADAYLGQYFRVVNNKITSYEVYVPELRTRTYNLTKNNFTYSFAGQNITVLSNGTEIRDDLYKVTNNPYNVSLTETYLVKLPYVFIPAGQTREVRGLVKWAKPYYGNQSPIDFIPSLVFSNNGRNFLEINNTKNAWYNANWYRKRKYTLNSTVGVNLTNFTINLTVDTATLISSNGMDPTCNDIRIVNCTENGLLNWGWESKNHATFGCNKANSKLRIQIPSYASSAYNNTCFYLYFKNSTPVTDVSNLPSVYDSTYQYAFLFHNTDVTDAKNGYTLVGQNSPTVGTSFVGNATNLSSAGNQYWLSDTESEMRLGGNFTVEAWSQPYNVGATNVVVSKLAHYNGHNNYQIWKDTNNKIGASFYWGDAGGGNCNAGGFSATGSDLDVTGYGKWYFQAVGFNKAENKGHYYENGALWYSASSPGGSYVDVCYNFYGQAQRGSIGAYYASGGVGVGGQFYGAIDEVVLRNVAPDGNYLKLRYDFLTTNLVKVGAVENQPTAPYLVEFGNSPIDNLNTSSLTVQVDGISASSDVLSYLAVYTNETSWSAKVTNNTPYNNSWWNTSVTFSTPGTYKIGIYANTSTLGNFSAVNRTVTIDQTAPTSLTYVAPTPPDYYYAKTPSYLEINVTYSDATPWRCYLWYDNDYDLIWTLKANYSAGSQYCFYNDTGPYTDQDIAYKVEVFDRTGHQTNSTERYWAVDNTAPIIYSLKYPTDGLSTNNTTIYFSINTSINYGCAAIWGNWSGSWQKEQTNCSGVCTYGAQMHCNYTFQIPGIPDGIFKWSASANDTLNNDNTSFTFNKTFTKDSTPPAVIYAKFYPEGSGDPYISNSTASIALCNVSDTLSGVNYVYFWRNGTGWTNTSGWEASGFPIKEPFQAQIVTDTPLSTGFYKTSCSACDVAGNCNYSFTVNGTWWHDVDFPTVSITTPLFGNVRNDSIFQYTGLSASDVGSGLSYIYIWTNYSGVWQRDFSVAASGDSYGPVSGEFTLPGGTNDGVYLFSTSSKDSADNELLTFSDNRTFYVDTTPPIILPGYYFWSYNHLPVATNVSPDILVAGIKDLSPACTELWTNFSGVWALTNSTCALWTDGYHNLTNQSFAFPSAGHWKLSVAGNDTFGRYNRSFAENATVCYDGNVINYTITNPSNSPYRTNTPFYINVTVNNFCGASQARLYTNFTGTWALNQTNSSPSGNSFSFLIDPLSDGTYKYDIGVTGLSGIVNNTFVLNQTIIKDTSAPSTELISPEDATYLFSLPTSHVYIPNDNLNSTLITTLYGTWNGGWHANYTNSSTLNGTETTASVDGLVPGTYTWGILSSDGLNNQWSVNQTFTVDLALPYVTKLTETPHYVNTTSFTLQALATDDIGLSNISIYSNITTAQTNSSPYNNTNTTFSFSGVPEGRYYWYAEACETSGRCNQTSNGTVYVDLTAPTYSGIQFEDASTRNCVNQGQAFDVYVTGSDALSGVQWYKVYSNWSWNGSDSSWKEVLSSTTSPLSNNSYSTYGIYRMSGTVTDHAGNENKSFAFNETVYFDGIAGSSSPQVSWHTPAANNSILYYPYILNATGLDLALWSCSFAINGTTRAGELYNTSTGGYCLTNLTDLPPGYYRAQSTLTDRCLFSNTTEDMYFTLDAVPFVNITSPVSPASPGNFNFTINTTDDVGVKNITFVSSFYNSSKACLNATSCIFTFNYSIESCFPQWYYATVYDAANQTNSTEVYTVSSTGDIALSFNGTITSTPKYEQNSYSLTKAISCGNTVCLNFPDYYLGNAVNCSTNETTLTWEALSRETRRYSDNATTFNVSGISLSGVLCYQEAVNVSNQSGLDTANCSLKYAGSWDETGNWGRTSGGAVIVEDNNASRMEDGDWTTSETSWDYNVPSYLLETYTLPTAANTPIQYQIKIKNDNLDDSNTFTTNITVPLSCGASTNLRFNNSIERGSTGGHHCDINITCMNSTGSWQNIYRNYTTFGYYFTYCQLYETALYVTKALPGFDVYIQQNNLTRSAPVSINSAQLNLSGTNLSRDVQIDSGNDGIIDVSLPGVLNGTQIIQDRTSSALSAENVSLVSGTSGTTGTFSIPLSKAGTQVYASFNLTGINVTVSETGNDTIDGTKTNYAQTTCNTSSGEAKQNATVDANIGFFDATYNYFDYSTYGGTIGQSHGDPLGDIDATSAARVYVECWALPGYYTWGWIAAPEFWHYDTSVGDYMRFKFIRNGRVCHSDSGTHNWRIQAWNFASSAWTDIYAYDHLLDNYCSSTCTYESATIDTTWIVPSSDYLSGTASRYRVYLQNRDTATGCSGDDGSSSMEVLLKNFTNMNSTPVYTKYARIYGATANYDPYPHTSYYAPDAGTYQSSIVLPATMNFTQIHLEANEYLPNSDPITYSFSPDGGTTWYQLINGSANITGATGSSGVLKAHFDTTNVLHTSKLYNYTLVFNYTSNLTDPALYLSGARTPLWNKSGTFNTTENVAISASLIDSTKSGCSTATCPVSFVLSSSKPAIMQVSNINFTYTANPLDLNTTAVKNALIVGSPVNFTFYNASNDTQVSGLLIDFNGQKNLTVRANTSGTEENATLQILFSNFSVVYPPNITRIAFTPSAPTQSNVQPLGQSAIEPVVKFYSNVDHTFNVYARVNSTPHTCYNFTVSNSSTKAAGFKVNTTSQYLTSANYSHNGTAWLWLDMLSCNPRFLTNKFIWGVTCEGCLG